MYTKLYGCIILVQLLNICFLYVRYKKHIYNNYESDNSLLLLDYKEKYSKLF